MLSVELNSIRVYGSVSKIVASEMLMGLEKIMSEKKNKSYLFSSITGIAGPTGGSEKKPIGLVWFGFRLTEKEVVKNQYLLVVECKSEI